jgi:3alpha(or 20beta)-hydroxysteroid dehydrogenase
VFILDNKVAVVTGGTSGIGLATAHRFVRAGAQVVIASRRDGKDIADKIGATFIRTDVGEEHQVQQLMVATAERFGRIDICVNNAGIFTEAKPLADVPGADMNDCFRVNTLGTLWGMQYAARYMPRGGSIINTSSLAGVIGMGGYSAYTASKFAIVGLTKNAAIEYGPKGIRVNCVCPATVDTPMLYEVAVGRAEAVLCRTTSTLDAITEAPEVAALIHFLAADDCMKISGQAILIDAGITAGYSMAMVEAVLKADGFAS